MAEPRTLIDDYLAGPGLLRQATRRMSRSDLEARPIAGKWSTLEVVCHITDFELVFADRIKRIIAEDQPKMMSGDQDEFCARLAYHERDLEEELLLIETTRRHVARILDVVPAAAFSRVGIHSTDGALTLEQILGRITRHIPHHLRFIAEKKQALGLL